MKVSAARRLGQVVTGLGALFVLVGLLAGGPIALLAFAGNPLPAPLPDPATIGQALTSRDDGQLFLSVLAVVGWLGWATFALSVLVELPARVLRRAAPRIPGMRRQQRFAAVLIGASALIVVAGPATAAVASAATTASVLAGPPPAAASAAGPSAMLTYAGPIRMAAPHAESRYRVERGDYLGAIADRYLGEFDEYPELARLNGISNPSLIHPGQLIRLPDGAHDDGFRQHATGMVTASGPWTGGPAQAEPDEPPPAEPPPGDPYEPPPPTDAAPPPVDSAPPPAPADPVPPAPGNRPPADPALPLPPAQDDGIPHYAAGPPDDGPDVNRPLAASAVITAAGIAGAQIGTVLGLRRKGDESGRHRADPA